MSVVYVLTLACDECGRWWDGLDMAGDQPPSVRAIRRAARTFKWSREGQRDLCPVCNGQDRQFWWNRGQYAADEAPTTRGEKEQLHG